MGLGRLVAIAVFGLSPREMRILQTICHLSKNHPRTFELVAADGTQEADFAVVDGDDPQAMAAWRRFSSSHPMLPMLMVGKGSKLEWPGSQVGRPLLASRVLGLFNQMELNNERPAFVSLDRDGPTQATSLAGSQEKSSSAAQPKHGQFAALVVDDSLPIRKQMYIELKPFIDQVDLAEDGEQAIELMAANTYDIVFLDVVLPGMDGYKLCKTIKRDRRTKETPVIMLTGKSSPFDRVKGKLAGCDTYLTKPVDLPTFEQVVRRYLLHEAQ